MLYTASLVAQTVKHLPTMRETWVRSLGWEDPFWRRKWQDPFWRRKWQPTPVLLPGKSHELRSLVGYSPWGRRELDTTKRLHFKQAWTQNTHLSIPPSPSLLPSFLSASSPFSLFLSFDRAKRESHSSSCNLLFIIDYNIRSDQSLSPVRLFATPWIAAR